MTPAYTYNATVLSVTDGDTVKLRVDLGFSVHIDVSIRLADVFAAERGQENGLNHTNLLKFFLPPYQDVVLVSKRIRGKDVTTFGRYVGDIYNLDGLHINEEMRKAIGEPQGKGVK